MRKLISVIIYYFNLCILYLKKNIKAILIATGASVALFFLLRILHDIKLPYLSCNQWIQPFLTVMALQVTALLVWAQFWKQHWDRLEIWERSDTSFSLLVSLAWIFWAILFSLFALISAVESCLINVCYMSPWSTAFAATSIFMIFILVLQQLVGTIYSIFSGHMPGKPIISHPSTSEKICWLVIFSFALFGIFLVSASLSGVTTKYTLSCTWWWIGKSLIVLATFGYTYQYAKHYKQNN